MTDREQLVREAEELVNWHEVYLPWTPYGKERQGLFAWHKKQADIIRRLLSLLPKEGDADSKRMNWLEEQANRGRFELTASLYRSGYEFGFWPTTGPVAEVHAGNLREAIDKAMIEARPK